MPRLLSFDGSGGCHSSAGCAVLGLPVRLSVNQGCCTGCNVAGAVDGVPAKHTEIPSPSRNRSQVSSPAIITTIRHAIVRSHSAQTASLTPSTADALGEISAAAYEARPKVAEARKTLIRHAQLQHSLIAHSVGGTNHAHALTAQAVWAHRTELTADWSGLGE